MRRQSNSLALAVALAMLASGASRAASQADQAAPPKAGASVAVAAKAPPAAPLVDLNRASAAELKTLPGIGEAEAAKIVAGRPYKSKTDLATRKVLTIEAYDRLSKQIAVDHRKPQPKAKT